MELIIEELYVINYEILFTSLHLIDLICRHFLVIKRSSRYLLFSEKKEKKVAKMLISKLHSAYWDFSMFFIYITLHKILFRRSKVHEPNSDILRFGNFYNFSGSSEEAANLSKINVYK